MKNTFLIYMRTCFFGVRSHIHTIYPRIGSCWMYPERSDLEKYVLMEIVCDKNIKITFYAQCL